MNADLLDTLRKTGRDSDRSLMTTTARAFGSRAKKANILELVVVNLQGNVAEPVLRPVSFNIDDDVERNLSRLVDKASGLPGRGAIRRAMGTSVSLEARAQGTPDIENGWRIGRSSVTMTVACQFDVGPPVLYILTGYTDRPCEVTARQRLDMDVKVIFTNITTMALSTTSNALGGSRTSVYSARAMDIVNPISINGARHSTYAISPAALLENIQANCMGAQADDAGYHHDIKAEPIRHAQLHNELSTTPDGWLGSIVHGYLKASGDESDDVSVYSAAAGYAELSGGGNADEFDVPTHPFLMLLTKHRRGGSAKVQFTLADLASYDPDLFAPTSTRLRVSKLGTARVIDHDSMGDSSPDTILATLVTHTATPIAVECCFSEVFFNINTRRRRNMGHLDDDPIVSVRWKTPAIQAMAGNSPEAVARLGFFESEFITRLSMALEGIFPEGANMLVKLHTTGYTEITYTTPDGDNEQYVVQSYARSSFSPIVTSSAANVGRLTDNVSELTTYLGELRIAKRARSSLLDNFVLPNSRNMPY